MDWFPKLSEERGQRDEFHEGDFGSVFSGRIRIRDKMCPGFIIFIKK